MHWRSVECVCELCCIKEGGGVWLNVGFFFLGGGGAPPVSSSPACACSEGRILGDKFRPPALPPSAVARFRPVSIGTVSERLREGRGVGGGVRSGGFLKLFKEKRFLPYGQEEIIPPSPHRAPHQRRGPVPTGQRSNSTRKPSGSPDSQV